MPGVLPWPAAPTSDDALSRIALRCDNRIAEGEREGRPELYEQFKDLHIHSRDSYGDLLSP